MARAGFTTMEIVVALGVLGLCILLMTQFISSSARQTSFIESLSTRGRVVDEYVSLVKNSLAWQNTVDSVCIPGPPPANQALKDHLTAATTPATTATPGFSALTLCAANGTVAVPAAGLNIDKFGKIATANIPVAWQLTVQWRGMMGNTGDIRLQLQPTPGTPASSFKEIHLHKGTYRPRCQVTTGLTPLAPVASYLVDGPYIWDTVILNCPPGYTRTGLGLKPGCGALNTHTYLDASNPNTGACYQISAGNPLVQAQMGCAPNSVQGTCSLICCTYD